MGNAASRFMMFFFVSALTLAGAFVAQRYAASMDLAWKAKSWMEVDAVLINWDLGVGRKGHSTSEVVAEYQWAHEGKTHGSKRVAVVGLRDSFSSAIKSEAKSKFIEASRNNGAMKIWMDPADPSQAVAVRTFPLSWAAFASFFLMIPCGISTAFALGALSKGVDAMLKRTWLSHRWGGLWLMLHGALALPALALAGSDELASWSGLVLMGLGLAFPVGAARFAWIMIKGAEIKSGEKSNASMP